MPVASPRPACRTSAGGLGNCFQDSEVCFWGTFCSPCLYGQIKARTGRAPDCWAGCLELVAVHVGVAIVGRVIVTREQENADPYNMQEAVQEAQTAQQIISILAMVSWLDAPVDAHSLRARQIPTHTLVCTTPLTRLVHGVLQCVIGYLVGKTRASMQAQYGYQARGIPPSGVAQPVPLDGNNFLMHCIPCFHLCALCEEARVAKVNSSTVCFPCRPAHKSSDIRR